MSPTNGIIPNLSGIELSEALARTLPFTSKEKDAPAFSQVVHFKESDGKLVVVVTTNTRIAEVTLGGVDKEAIKASQSLGAMWISQYLKPQYNTLILSIGDNRLTLTAQGNTGSQAHIPADTDGEAVIALQARYLTQALKACGGMVSLKVKDENSPMLFETDGYRFLVMPMTDVPEVAS